MVSRSMSVVLLLAVAGLLHAEGLAVTRAAAEPASVLPGIPFWISLTVTNSGKRPVSMPRTYLVEVTPAEGPSFVAEQVTTRVAQLPAEYAGPQSVISAGSSRVVDFAAGDDLGTGILFEQRLWAPGKYVMRLVFSDELTEAAITSPHWSAAIASPAVVSLPFEIVVERPVGSDAAVWSAVLEATHHRAWLSNSPTGGATAQALWERFPDTKYAAYLIRAAVREVRRNGGPARAARVDDMLKTIEDLDSTGILAEEIRLGRSLQKAQLSAGQSDVGSALRAADSVRHELERLSADSSLHEHTRLRARLAVDAVESADAIRQRFRDASDR
jgi:hypothetical protein